MVDERTQLFYDCLDDKLTSAEWLALDDQFHNEVEVGHGTSVIVPESE